MGAACEQIFSPITSGLSQLIGDVLPVGGWRIYTISGSMPIFDRKAWRLEIAGLVKKPLSLTTTSCSRYRGRADLDLSLRYGLTVNDVHWAGVRFKDLLALAEPCPKRARSASSRSSSRTPIH